MENQRGGLYRTQSLRTKSLSLKKGLKEGAAPNVAPNQAGTSNAQKAQARLKAHLLSTNFEDDDELAPLPPVGRRTLRKSSRG